MRSPARIQQHMENEQEREDAENLKNHLDWVNEGRRLNMEEQKAWRDAGGYSYLGFPVTEDEMDESTREHYS